MLKIAVLVSGGGTNLQALIDAEKNGEIKNGTITCVIASNREAPAIERAKKAQIKTEILVKKEFETPSEYDEALLNLLEKDQIDLVVLAGFMTILSDTVIAEYRGRIINVHPSLIPAFCGDGFYGIHVHRAALERGVKLTGATVHFVDEVCDGGPIILQKAVEVKDDDTPEMLQRRVMKEAEWILLPKAVSFFCEGKLDIIGNRVLIRKTANL